MGDLSIHPNPRRLPEIAARRTTLLIICNPSGACFDFADQAIEEFFDAFQDDSIRFTNTADERIIKMIDKA